MRIWTRKWGAYCRKLRSCRIDTLKRPIVFLCEYCAWKSNQHFRKPASEREKSFLLALHRTDLDFVFSPDTGVCSSAWITWLAIANRAVLNRTIVRMVPLVWPRPRSNLGWRSLNGPTGINVQMRTKNAKVNVSRVKRADQFSPSASGFDFLLMDDVRRRSATQFAQPNIPPRSAKAPAPDWQIYQESIAHCYFYKWATSFYE